jgi:hypothetical protein
VQPEKACPVRGESSELRQRIEELKEAMRSHDIEEGYEWPGIEEVPEAETARQA